MSLNLDSTKPEGEKFKPHTVLPDEQDMRVDRWFKHKFPDLTHGQIQKYLRTGQIRVDGKRAEASDHLKSGQIIRIPPPLYDKDESGKARKGSAVSERMARINQSRTDELKKMIIYQDDDVIVLNKPAGLAVQGGTGLKENLDDNLMLLSKDGKTKPKLVHRLDRDTSGVLLIARTDYAARQLAASFRERETKKIYWAAVVGKPKPERGKISAPLIKSGEIMRVSESKSEDERAKSAITLYQVMESALDKISFVALWPVTGRTHQLRAHLAHLGTPILGDRLYGKETRVSLPMDELGKGLHLHARRLIIPHPRRGVIDVSAPLSKEMKKTWKWLNFDAKADVDFDF